MWGGLRQGQAQLSPAPLSAGITCRRKECTECLPASSLDSRLRVRFDRNNQETSQLGSKLVYNPANIERDHLRENVTFSDAYRPRHDHEDASFSQPIESIR